MELEALRDKVAAYNGHTLAPGLKIDSGMTACPHDEMLFEAVRFWIEVGNNRSLNLIGRVFYWHATDGGWHKTTTLKTFGSVAECAGWLKNEHHTNSAECASILKSLGR